MCFNKKEFVMEIYTIDLENADHEFFAEQSISEILRELDSAEIDEINEIKEIKPLYKYLNEEYYQ
ncbi:hypothetical protein COU14_00820 [Candidatus Kaiserbacteria bacterium CG10_big_fil_rev_8_21_14_0_10_44_10]|uniref:Uncharacterized protein n=1 Tax=Candidatus Kaiserbacteria bacterium CG10_big_fil_rev_8_21_14_0_10_44_10 TaxID=1974606 RepID=A0A2H0UI53_9BACT|nr:MAG: hypothetical protein COU14_00820 [Candidatus Kaiserbacteria bacterium CG10_big_fil_rev_8_21_14_0_10_44_10]